MPRKAQQRGKKKMDPAAMEYYFAPLEGNTGYVYRNVHYRFFPETDRYYTPFVAPNHTLRFRTKEMDDIDPAHNAGVPLVPQVLSNRSQECLWAIRELAQMGYKEVNLNLGCPVPTVARKRRGSGMLKYTQELDAFLEEVFEGVEGPGTAVSVKTRLGTDSTEEAEGLIGIYNRYPISELTVHPRSQKDMYKGTPDYDAFAAVLCKSRIPIVYNGNIFTGEDRDRLLERFPQVRKIMAGRGVLADPALIRVLKGGPALQKAELRAFHDALLDAYKKTLPGTNVVIGRMKEFWHYTGTLFPEGEKLRKEIRKARDLGAYEAAVRVLMSSVPMNGSYSGQ